MVDERNICASSSGVWLRRGLGALWVAGLCWLSVARLRPPAGVAGKGFSLERAMGDLQVIAKERHPFYSPANAVVREYLIGKLKEMGLEVEVQNAAGVSGLGVYGRAVNNIIGRRAGRESGGKALMLCAHYDSHSAGPGASDDGAGVAAVLEAVRVVMHEGGLRNDLIVLISDGEEGGLFGAKAFVRANPLASSVALVLNFEARGTSGP